MCAAAPDALSQSATPATDTIVAAPDPGDVRGAARAAQARFELRRIRHLPRALGGSHGPCDETVGRFCTWYEEGEWVPEPEAPEITALRDALLDELDTLQAHLPGDGWILGQRVWYRAERGDRQGALALARACGPPQDAWWCLALTGFALHGLERYPEAGRAFDSALYVMDLERAWQWRVPEMAVDGDARAVLEELRAAPADSVERVLDRLWRLADPLLLVPGNDRRTEHLARWTVAALRDGARNPYRISWGSDLEELVVRHGWELGWERSMDARYLTPQEGVIGHKHPEGRDYMPPGRALLEPRAVRPEDLEAGHLRPRSLYAPPYAPVTLPMDGQVARFPRGRRLVVVATHHLPEDTTYHADHDHPRPWMEPGDQRDLTERAGAFLVDLVTGETSSSFAEGRTEGTLLIETGPGLHLLSVEAWSPPLRRAGRHRAVVEHVPAPDDVPVLSDLLLLEALEARPPDLGSAVEAALVRPVVEPETPLALAWEVSGIGFRNETLAFELSVTRTDRGLLSRLGGLLGIGERPRPMTLAWEEGGPERPGVVFHHVDLELPVLEAGRYEIRLVVRIAGREPLERILPFMVPER